MEKAGDIFNQERERQALSIEEVVKQTKIPQDFLIAIESNNYSKLPQGLYPHLYVRKYASLLGLSEERMVAIFRRDYQEKKGYKKQILKGRINAFSRLEKVAGGGIVIFIFVGYLIYQYLTFVSPPKVKYKVNNFSSGEVTITGKTNPRATLRIEGEIVGLDEKGRFFYQVENGDKKKIILIVESPSGKSQEVTAEIRD